MLAIKSFIRIVVIAFLEIISFDRFYANSRSCYEVANKMICYFKPNEANTEMTWDNAWKVCKDNNSTLPVIDNQLVEETFKNHVKSTTTLMYQLWLAGREIRTDNWQWLNGQLFGQQSILKERGFRNDTYETNAVIEDFKYKPINPSHSKYYICHYTDSKLCQHKSIIPWKNGCLFVNNDERLNLINARNRCLDEGGDLTTFEEDEDFNMLKQTNSSLLHKHREYWIGLRLNWWIWNETDSRKEVKYSNWYRYDNYPSQKCLYILHNYKWNQEHCTTRKLFLCQTVNTTSQTLGDDDADKYISVAIIGSIVAVVIVAVIIVVLVVIVKIPRSGGVNRRSDKMPTAPHEMSAHPVENKSVKSKAIEENEMSNHYAEIPRAVDHESDDECRDEPQPGIVYAALEFDANKATYEETVISSERKQEARASAMVGALNGNGQPGSSSAESPIQAAEGTIYANM